MIAKELESILQRETERTDLSYRAHADLVQRFQNLRGSALLPRGRGKNAEHLSPAQAVAGLLSITTEKPGFAALAAITLRDLRPVGGVGASFFGCKTFGSALGLLLSDTSARSALKKVRISVSEIITNTHGRAAIEYSFDGVHRVAWYVNKLAASLMQPGAELTFDVDGYSSTIVGEMVYHPRLFEKVAYSLAIKLPLLVPETEEEDEETRRENRLKQLGVRPGAEFLNMGITCHVTWPKKETVVEFEGCKLILMPKTRENTTSIHIDLHNERLTLEGARTLINRFLSLVTWCDDHSSIPTYGWSGNPVPVAVSKPDAGFSIADPWLFERRIPPSKAARQALAIYREARNAQVSYSAPYAVLCYYKLIELKFKGTADTKKWFRANLEAIRKNKNLPEELARFDTIRGAESPEGYLWRACRCAVAHANKPYSTDPDDYEELQRLHIAADILRALARQFIKRELGVSDDAFDGS